jgi:hypothetical protein
MVFDLIDKMTSNNWMYFIYIIVYTHFIQNTHRLFWFRIDGQTTDDTLTRKAFFRFAPPTNNSEYTIKGRKLPSIFRKYDDDQVLSTEYLPTVGVKRWVI